MAVSAIPSVGTTDHVTVSPPSTLAGDLLLVGWNVLIDGQVTVYLYNASSEAITTGSEPWTIRYLDLTP